MTTTFRSRSLLGAGATAALLTLAGCGGMADDAPTNASVEEFCAAYQLDDSAKNAAEKMADVGTPEGLSDAQRKGFEVYVDGLNDEGDTKNSDITSVDVPQDDKEDGEAFLEYAADACAATGDPSAPPADGGETPPATEPAPSESAS